MDMILLLCGIHDPLRPKLTFSTETLLLHNGITSIRRRYQFHIDFNLTLALSYTVRPLQRVPMYKGVV